MDGWNIPVGISDFAEIRKNGYYYIDKSGLICELLRTPATKVTLFTRPRRFGKTLGMRMLAEFFDIHKDTKKLFEGLMVSKDEAACSEWMNQWPTVFLSFKDIDGLSFENAYARMKALIAQLYMEHRYLTDSAAMAEYEKEQFNRIVRKTASLEEVQNSLSFLMKCLQIYYGKSVILLLDEYDVPIAKASSNGYYNEMMEVMKAMMSTALKDNSCLQFAVITGCLRIAKESIFTGTNNFVTYTISDRRFQEFFGFTDTEVKKLLQDTGCEKYYEKVREWYDGYQFGDNEIYCPWDVLNYVKKINADGLDTPENFWEHTSDNAIIASFLERTDLAVDEKFEVLLAGGYIRETIEENLTYDVLTSSESNFWSLLYLTGYLTKVKTEDFIIGDSLKEKQVALKIPNAEVMDIFRKSVVEWFNRKAAGSDRREIFRALWEGDDVMLTQLVSDLLFDTISYHDYKESFYHAFLAGLVSGAGYVVESNYENGLGRADLIIKDRKKRRAVVIEIKITDSQENMEDACKKALTQIADRKYAEKVTRSGFKTVICFGMAFYQKSCMVMKERL